MLEYMRLHRFFVTTPIEGSVVSIHDTNLLHQWKNVFRYQVGAQVILLDNSGKEFLSLIESLTNREAVCVVRETRNGQVPHHELWLCLSLIKKDRFEMAVEKATELGVSHIVPVIADRSVKMRLHMDRLNAIAVEASEQCGRARLPVIHHALTLHDALHDLQKERVHIVIAEKGKYAQTDIQPAPCALCIGPEGGWSDQERELFTRMEDVHHMHLGDFTLRAETAVVAGLVRLMT